MGFWDELGIWLNKPASMYAGAQTGMAKLLNPNLDPGHKLDYGNPLSGLIAGATNKNLGITSANRALQGQYDEQTNGLKKVLGMGLDAAADPTMWIPGVGELGVASEAGKAGKLISAASSLEKLGEGASRGEKLAQTGRRFVTGSALAGPAAGLGYAVGGRWIEPVLAKAAKGEAVAGLLGKAKKGATVATDVAEVASPVEKAAAEAVGEATGAATRAKVVSPDEWLPGDAPLPTTPVKPVVPTRVSEGSPNSVFAPGGGEPVISNYTPTLRPGERFFGENLTKEEQMQQMVADLHSKLAPKKGPNIAALEEREAARAPGVLKTAPNAPGSAWTATDLPRGVAGKRRIPAELKGMSPQDFTRQMDELINPSTVPVASDADFLAQMEAQLSGDLTPKPRPKIQPAVEPSFLEQFAVHAGEAEPTTMLQHIMNTYPELQKYRGAVKKNVAAKILRELEKART